MDIDAALAADSLWGWPVELLDRLLGLQQRAWAGVVPLEAWRTEDAELRAGQPPVDPDEVGAVLTEWIGSGRLSLLEHGQLLSRLTVLANRPPTDDDLWAELGVVMGRLASSSSPARSAVDGENRDRIVSWLTRSGGGVDGVTGLPWSVVARHRASSGSVDGARQAALDGATELERECADLLASRRSELGSETADAWPAP